MEKIIFHGSPCQDFSLAGKQAGGEQGSGTRSSLLYETIRIVEKTKPKYVIWENVKNVLSKKHRQVFDDYLAKMEQLGYANYYQVLNAKDYGIPQNRERVFCVSMLYDDFENDFDFPPKQELKLKLKDLLENEVDEKFYLSDEKISKIANWKAYQKPFERVLGKDSVSPTLTARGAGEEHSGMITYSENLKETTNLQKIICKQRSDEGLRFFKNNVCGSLRTIDSCGDKRILEYPFMIRKLTPLECWRLMGFDDEDFYKAQQVNSNTQLYKQAGNSIVVNVLEHLFNNLLDKNKEYELLELFGGIGAPRKALERQGFNIKVFDYVEWDKFAVKSYNAIYNEEFEPQDVSEWDKEW